MHGYFRQWTQLDAQAGRAAEQRFAHECEVAHACDDYRITTIEVAATTNIPETPAVQNAAAVAEAQREAAAQQQIAICQDVMRQRPLNTPPRSPMEMSMALISGDPYRRAAMELCLSDPLAHLKPLPWETQAPPTQRQPTVCFTQPGGMVVCP